MRFKLSLFLFIVILSVSNAQRDSAAYDLAKVRDGVYLTYDDFRINKIIGKECIVSNIDKNQQEFLTKVMSGETFSYKREDSSVAMMDCREPWAYVQNGTFYVNFKNEFYRVPVFGNISYFVARVVNHSPGLVYNPGFGYVQGPATTTEIREFVIDMNTGEMQEFRLENVENMLRRDQAFYEEYNKMSRRQKKDRVYLYIRKYNERHPVYFLK